MPKSQKKRVEEYFAFAFYLENHSKILNRQDLDGKISSSLVNSIIYYSSKGHLKPPFAEFGSENLLKDISYHLTNVIYLPQDFIIEKGTVGEEMYFLVEGLVMIIAGDK